MKSTNESKNTRENLVYKAVWETGPVSLQGIRYHVRYSFHQYYTTNQIYAALVKLRKQGLIVCKQMKGVPVWESIS